MRPLRIFRWLLPVLLGLLIPASSFAGVFISVGFAPPPLVVYEQPPCPQPGLIWTPGYWAYGPDGYYWVPGAWVPAPYEGAYWTPGYWGWGNGLYMWHPGYWGRHVGYYGGINYGYGYFGTGFVGGMWRGPVFAYNTAVMRVNTRVIRNVYVDREVIRTHRIVDNHVAYNGGPGGVMHAPTREERAAMEGPHMAATRFQQQHRDQAMQNHAAYFRNNHGRPSDVVTRHPLPAERQAPPAVRNGPMNNNPRSNVVPNRGRNGYEPNRGGQTVRPNEPRNPNNGMRPAPEPQRQQQQRQFEQQQRQRQFEQQQRQNQQRQMEQQRPPTRQARPEMRQPEAPRARPQERPQERQQPRPQERQRNNGDGRR